MENINKPPMPIRSKYPFNKMKEGDYVKLSFSSESDAMKARIAALTYGSTKKIKFATRRTGSDLEVWRAEEPAAIDPFFGE